MDSTARYLGRLELVFPSVPTYCPVLYTVDRHSIELIAVGTIVEKEPNLILITLIEYGNRVYGVHTVQYPVELHVIQAAVDRQEYGVLARLVGRYVL